MPTLVHLLLTAFLTLTYAEYIPPGPKYPCPKETDKQVLLHPCTCEKGTDSGLHVSCENAGLATLSVGLNNIASLGLPVDVLVLRECRFARLFGPIFQKSSLRILTIEDTPLKFIEADVFVGTNGTLNELHIKNTKLESFPKEAFRILGNLTTLNIDGHEIQTLDKDVFHGSEMAARIERLRITNGALLEIPVEPFQFLKKLKSLDLHGNNITALKRNQFKGLRELELLDISHNSIEKLEGAVLGDLAKLGWCNVSHNRVAELGRAPFARSPLLKALHLDSNRLQRLDANTFKGMRFLRRLYLQDNAIESVGTGAFTAAARIGTVHLARNRLTSVPYQMFHQLRYAELIDLSDNRIESIDKQAFTELYLAVVNLAHNNLTHIAPDAFLNCQNMTLLDLSYNKLSEIARGAFDSNSYALEFRITHNSLTALDQIPLQNMTGIKIVNASYNEIRSIPKGTFPKLYELHTVDVSHNQLADIHPAVFQTLFSLRYVNLSHNALEAVRGGTFGSLPTVLELDLSHNRLAAVARGALAQLPSCARLLLAHNRLATLFQVPISLGFLDLSHNALSEIADNSWPSMNALLRLDLSHNALADALGAGAFTNLLTLRELHLAHNGITTPPRAALAPLSSLQHLHMPGNRLSALERAAFGKLPTLFELDVSNNSIGAVSARAFEGLLQLLQLDLSRNKLAKIPNEAFKGLVSLRALDLSHNKLSRIDNKTHGLLDDCLSLERVNLSHNRMSFVTRKTFPSDPYIPYRLREVDLSHNGMPVLTEHIAHGTKHLRRLILANNAIADIRKDVLKNLTALEYLDLSGNKLTSLYSQSLSERVFDLPENISELILRDNALDSLPMDKLSAASRLRRLDVRGNLLTSFYPELVAMMDAANVSVYFSGNILECDCFARPLRHYLDRLPRSRWERDERYTSLECAGPTHLSGRRFVDVAEELLLCAGSVATLDKMAAGDAANMADKFDFVAQPDLVFRDVQFTQSAIYTQWYVLSTDDVANFNVFVRDGSNALFFHAEVHYALRNLTIAVDQHPDLKDALLRTTGNTDQGKDKGSGIGELELCIQAKESTGAVRPWAGSQCRRAPPHYLAWPKAPQSNKRKSLSSRTHRRYSSSALSLLGDSVLITLCIFLSCFCRRLCDLQ